MIVKYVVSNYRYISLYEFGVAKKINAQVSAFRRAGIECSIDDCNSDYTTLTKVLTRIPFLKDGINWNSVDINNCDLIYIRRPAFCSYSFIKWLKDIKASRANLKILLEFQTYPYDAEYYKLYRLPLLMKDRAHRASLKKYVDRVVDYSGRNSIFGIPTIQVINGIDLTSISVRSPVNYIHSKIQLLCVAVFNTWHGIDRVFDGIAGYMSKNGERSITLHLVGEGQIIEQLKAQVKQLGIEEAVVFHGLMKQDEFSYLYDECDLAIECLGNHRKNVPVSSSLKSREYLAKGMPFVYSGSIDIFLREPVDFCLQIPADDSPVDIEQLIAFRDYIYAQEPAENLAKRIRSYAERHVSMDAAMKPVIDYIKEDYND